MKVQHTVTLLHNSPLFLAAHGARTCWDSHDKSDSENLKHCDYCDITFTGEFCPNCDCGDEDNYSYPEAGPKDRELIDRVGNKFRHASILEHLNYTFYIEGISRACLQELSRHRIASPSVKSSRYTLKELKDEAPFTIGEDRSNSSRIAKYLVLTDVETVDDMSVQALNNLRIVVAEGISNDKTKYCMPEAYKVDEQLTINARSLQNFLSLRSDKSALWEIQQLAHSLHDALPEEHKYLFTDYIKGQQ